MRKIGSIHSAGHPIMVIYYDDKATVNPFRICLEWYEDGRRHRKQVNRYADLFSCGIEMEKYTQMFNFE